MRWGMAWALILVCGAVGCGSSSSSRPPAPAHALPGGSSALPFTGPTPAQLRFAHVLDRRCRVFATSLRRIGQPQTLAAQAAASEAQARILTRMLSVVGHLSAPPPVTYIHDLRSALQSVVQDDGYVVDAAKRRYGEAVAVWLGRQAAARRSLNAAAAELLATSCRL